MYDLWGYFRRGAVQGALAWIVYGAVEAALFSLGQLLFTDKQVVVAWHWRMTLRLLAAYVAIGLVAGGFGGLAVAQLIQKTRGLADESQRLYQCVGTLTLTVAYLVNLVVSDTGEGLLVPFSVGMTLTLIIAAGMLSERWRGWSEVTAEPWLAAALLLGTPWLAQTLRSSATVVVKGFVLFAFFGGVLFLALAGRSLLQPRQYARYGLTVAVAAVVVLGGVAVLNEQLPTPSGSEPGGAEIDAPPNVVLIVMDTVRADHMSAYGYERETTPRLEELAEGATLYESAIASSNFTLPTHASMFTGLYSRSHGSHYIADEAGFEDDYGQPLGEGFLTLAEILADQGYATLGVAANYLYLAPDFGLDQGSQLFDARAPAPVLRADRPHSLRWGVRRLLSLFSSTLGFDRLTRHAAEITEDARSLLDLAAVDATPFFLFVNYMDAHEPYVPPAPFDTLFPGRDERFTHHRYQSILEEVSMNRERDVTETEYAHFVSQYDGAIAYVDRHVGIIVEWLREAGLYENTLIIVTSDHGEAFGERSLLGHMASLYQNQIFVPLVVKYPGQVEGAVVRDPVSHVDILPTVLGLIGLAPPGGLHGASLVVSAPRNAEAYVVSEDFGNPYQNDTHRRFALLSGQWKLLSSSDGSQELYDLVDDPAEKNDLFSPIHPASSQLSAVLQRWLEAIPVALQRDSKLSEEVLERLRSLGYIR